MARSLSNKRKTNKGVSRTAFFLSAAAILLLAFGIASVSGLGAKFGYPRRYEKEVLASSREHGLDPDLVFAVIRTESGFEPQAVSHAGAEGLMQIMPVTAEWIAWRRGYTHDSGRVFEPAYNIDMGCYLLSYLLDYYENDLILAVAAYNAGAGKVDGWLKQSDAHGGEELDIPPGETKNYVEKVLESYENYKRRSE